MLKLRKKQKGFTLTELAIVIAVIAILIAVLVPTFTSIINKANDSVDMQAAKNLNTTLSAGSAADSPENIGEVIDILVEDGYAENVTPYSSDYVYKWDKEQNVIVLYDTAEKTVLYPADYEGDITTLYNLTYNSSEYGGFAYGTGEEESPYEIATLEHLESLRTLIGTSNGDNTKNVYFELTRDLNLGSTWAPLGTTSFEQNGSGSVTVYADGCNTFYGTLEGNNKTITVNDSSAVNSKSDLAIFANIGAGAVIQNLNVYMNVSKEGGCYSCGAVASYVRGIGVDGDESVLFKNITVTGTITAYAHGGGVVGWSAMGCQFINCVNYANITTTVGSTDGYYSAIGGICAQASGYMYNGKYGDDFIVDGSVLFENCTNYGTLTHAYTGSDYTSHIGQMTGQLASSVTLTAVDGYTIGYCTLTFNNCVCDGKIYGVKKSSDSYYYFVGNIYDTETEASDIDSKTSKYIGYISVSLTPTVG